MVRRLVLDHDQRIEATARVHSGADDISINNAMKPRLDTNAVLAAHLRLFSPACCGTNFSSWAGFAIAASRLVAAAAAGSLVKNELLPGSPILETLKKGTEKAHSRFPTVQSLYTRPLFGNPDQIVYSDSIKERNRCGMTVTTTSRFASQRILTKGPWSLFANDQRHQSVGQTRFFQTRHSRTRICA